MSRINGFIERHDLLKLVSMGGVGIAATASSVLPLTQQAIETQSATEKFHSDSTDNDHHQNSETISPNAALERLLDGNKRFVQQKSIHPDQTLARLQLIAKGQHPFAAILGCADSRVPAEIVFDEGLGDLFNVRVAGNIVTPEGIGSLEYSTAVLGAQLIMVLGHRKCGAVAEAVKGEPLPGRIGTFVEAIKPAVAKVKSSLGDTVDHAGTNVEYQAGTLKQSLVSLDQLLDDAVVANVKYQVEMLKHSPILAQLVQQSKLKIVGARYNLDTGKVTIVT